MSNFEIDSFGWNMFFGPRGPVAELILIKGEQVRAASIENASGKMLRVRTGDLLHHIQPVHIERDAQGIFVKIGSTATHPFSDEDQTPFAYPTYLEGGKDGVLGEGDFPWLSTALREVFPS